MARTFLDAMASGEPEAPWFARVAMEFLTRGEPSKAAELCRAGLRRHPDYDTGLLVLGKCFAALGRGREAVLAFQKVLQRLPDNATVRSLLAEQEAREEKEFGIFRERCREQLKESGTALTLEEFLAGENTESTVDYLLKQLEEVRRAKPSVSPPVEGSDAPVDEPQSARIITVTLAEIYATQGQIAEAIAAYRKLMELRPAEQSHYAARIEELEVRLRETQ
jgi:cytochrome c-type biogenesis protein CcmH/NrfG